MVLAICGLAFLTWSQTTSPSRLADAAIQNAPGAQAPAAPKATELSAPGSVHGVVVDREGTACEGAHVVLEQTSFIPSVVRSATSDSSGRFNFPAVAPGAFNLSISSGGFATQVVVGYLRPGESYEAQPIALLVTTAKSEVRVTASPREIAQEQIREEEQQRVLGIIPNFFVSYSPDALPLTPRQKFHLAWKDSFDPVTLMSTAATAAFEQAGNSYPGFAQGAAGYAKRYAAAYGDDFIGTMIGSAILPSLLKQDPRYFYKGTGTVRSRFFYAIESSVICRSDAGRRQLNYSNLIANLGSAGISNLYYPAADRHGVTLTFENFLISKAISAGQNIFQEFFVRKFTRRAPIFGPPGP